MPAATPGNGFWRDAENGHRDGRAPQQSPSWWPCASTGQWQFGVDERGKGRLKSFRAKSAKAAKSRSDAMTIAQPFMAGYRVNKMKSPTRDGRKILSSLTGLGTFPNREPSHKWLGYFQGQRHDAENGNRDGRAPQQSPSRAVNGSLGWTNGAKGV